MKQREKESDAKKNDKKNGNKRVYLNTIKKQQKFQNLQMHQKMTNNARGTVDLRGLRERGT